MQRLVVAAQTGQLAQTDDKVAWIWTGEGNPAEWAPEGTRYFVRVLPMDRLPVLARIKCWADDRARVFVNGHSVLESRREMAPVVTDIRDNITTGVNLIAVEGYNWQGAAGIALEIELQHADGETTTITGDNAWLAAVTARDDWTTNTPDEDSWSKAMVLGHGLMPPWGLVPW